MRQHCCSDLPDEPVVLEPEAPITVLGCDNPVDAEDLRTQDFVQFPENGGTWLDRWWVVEDIHLAVDEQQVHLLLRRADPAEVSFERFEAARERLNTGQA